VTLVSHPTSDLTERERTIIGLIANGRSNKAISKSLGIELGTIKAHVTTIKRKLDARNRAHIAGLGVQDLGIRVFPNRTNGSSDTT
jgi:DNA-binding CsgD family transcriptional regulator